ncbi:hypothetical protein DVH05_008750 [Phytophthora capsici]|nr:hypothetical protein DVH05_008750 [Phytophthora capsici]
MIVVKMLFNMIKWGVKKKESRGRASASPAAQVHQGHDAHVQMLDILRITGGLPAPSYC